MPVIRADVAEAEDFLAAHPEVAFIDLVYTSLTGVPRGKRIRRGELLGVYQQGLPYPGSALVIDTLGQDVAETGLLWEDGDADRLLWPSAGMLKPAPSVGGHGDLAQVICSFYERDGRPSDLDPRHILATLIDRLAAQGLTAVGACELEFYLLGAWDGGRTPSPARSLFSSHAPFGEQVFGLRELEDVEPFLRDLYTACDRAELPVECVIAEAAAGQFELTLHHRADLLRAVDEALLYKKMVKTIATSHGVEATFMAKPFANSAGNGLHVHLSLLNTAGLNLFAGDAPDLSDAPLLVQTIAGLQALAPASMAILAPGANSYRRLALRSYAPLCANWGVDNRTAALRVTGGAASNRHLEHRIAGADANLYLAMAVVLAGAVLGMEQKLAPGAPTVGDGYAHPGAGSPDLPRHWAGALDAFSAEPRLADLLGARFQRLYATVKQVERQRYESFIPTLDYDWYLRNA